MMIILTGVEDWANEKDVSLAIRHLAFDSSLTGLPLDAWTAYGDRCTERLMCGDRSLRFSAENIRWLTMQKVEAVGIHWRTVGKGYE